MTSKWNQAAQAISLVPVGAAVGTAVGFLTIVGIAVSAGEVPRLTGVTPLVFLGMLFGAPAGAVVGPLIGALLLNRVSLGRMILVTSAAGIVSGVIAARVVAALNWIDGSIIAGVPGAILGCIAAAAWLRLRSAGNGPEYGHAA